MSGPAIGDPAPDFALPDQDGRVRRLAEHRGRWLVLFFYPKDETPGCVAEVCGFRDHFAEFGALDADVLGVSHDSVETHKGFATRRRLPYPLLSDPKREAIRAYGASLAFDLYTRRKTVVIDPAGIVRGIYESNLHAEDHVPEALAIVRAGRPPS